MGDYAAMKDVNAGPSPSETFELPLDLVKDPTAASAHDSEVQRPSSVVTESDDGVPKKGRRVPLDLSPSESDVVDDGTR